MKKRSSEKKECCPENKAGQDEKYMREALRQARKAYALEEVPIGCVIVYQGKIIGRGYNRRTVDKNPLAHAELTAIRKAARKLNDWRLEECTLYVTLEPCQMCSGAIVQARIPRVVVGCMNPKAGCAGSILNLLCMREFNHQVDLTTGILEEECSGMMKLFFRELREKQKKRRAEEICNGALGDVQERQGTEETE
ncbi:MAG: nucleoside deaminase [Ruminococcus sp.]|nr:nucleoside deaminase [Ruminococcus sp.]